MKESDYYKGKSPLIERFLHAFRGIGYAWDKEQNFRIEILFALAVLGALVILPVSPIERAILVLIIALVLSLEMINSVFERLLDVIHPKFSPEVKRIKDTLAGVVFLASSSSIIIATLILVKHLIFLDSLIQESLFRIRSPLVISFAEIATSLGEWKLILVVTFFLVIFLIYKKRYLLIGLLLGSVLPAGFFALALKLFFGRTRPPGIELVESGYSFPSGHVFIGTVFWLAFTYILTDKYRKNSFVWFIPAIIIPLIAFTRIILSVHWVSDIAGGFLFGLFWFLFWFGLNERFFLKK